jgi:hypothetical protein
VNVHLQPLTLTLAQLLSAESPAANSRSRVSRYFFGHSPALYPCVDREKREPKIKEVLNMKIQNIIRTNAVAIGFAAALFLATTPVRSQEITNSEFSQGADVTAFAQPTADMQQAAAPVTQATTTQAPAAVVSTPVISNTQVESMVTTAGDWMLASALSGLALIGLYAIAEIRRANRSTRPRPPLTRHIALS